jgi:hypothetical protein
VPKKLRVSISNQSAYGARFVRQHFPMKLQDGDNAEEES